MTGWAGCFDEIWAVDFEFHCPPGERPQPICLVAQEIYSGRIVRLWEDDLVQMKGSPFPAGDKSLFVAFYASAEFGCYLALGWAMPVWVLDLFVEFRCLTNGRVLPYGFSLLGAALHFGLPETEAATKEDMRGLAIRGGPFSEEEKVDLLNYCEADVHITAELFHKMVGLIDWSRALWRGRYMKAVARMEYFGVPIDTALLSLLKARWPDIQTNLIQEIDVDYGVYEGRTFKIDRFEAWLSKKGITWPRLPSGRLDLSDDTFREMARSHYRVAPLRELRSSLGQMRLNDLAVGADRRNRTLLSPFRSKTGRNQPSNSKFIFGPSTWLRSLIKPEPDHGLAYVDWCQQEFGIAAYLSGDPNMIKSYESGDPYLEFAKLTGGVTLDGTKESHPRERDLFKACILGVQYGMGSKSLGFRIGMSPCYAEELIRMHRRVFSIFWIWSDNLLEFALIQMKIKTVFGWEYRITGKPNPRSIRNFPIQANGAEMLRLACVFITEMGIELCAPVHDAVLIHFPLDKEQQIISATQQAMSDASAAVLGGYRLRPDVSLVRYPGRYQDDRGAKMWETVMRIITDRNVS
ncbi:MAG: DNA polymerase I [Deltaproteobacteria bacterium]|nr:DNA polymerase I [Deltaproteobacteria bacterium]